MSLRKEVVLRQERLPLQAESAWPRDIAAGSRLQWRTTRALFDLLAAGRATRIVAALITHLGAIYWVLLAPYERAIRWVLDHLAGGNVIILYLEMLAVAHVVVPMVIGSVLTLGWLTAQARGDLVEEVAE